MTDDERRQWLDMLGDELRLRNHLGDFYLRSSSRKGDRLTASREWWRQVEITLQKFVDLNESGRHVQPFPRDLLETLSGLAGEFATGRIPEPVKDGVMIGNKPHSPRKRRDIAWAIAYVDAAKRGEINDYHYLKTVAQQYGVSTTTVGNWVKSRSEICAGLDLSGSPEQINATMHRAAKYYQKATGKEPNPKDRKRKGDTLIAAASAREGDERKALLLLSTNGVDWTPVGPEAMGERLTGEIIALIATPSGTASVRSLDDALDYAFRAVSFPRPPKS